MKIIFFVLIISILLIVLINYIKYRVDMKLLKIYKNNVFITNQEHILNEYPVSDEIPKIIHQSDKDIENFKKFDLENDINKKNCPGYDFRFYDNEDIVFYIKNNFNSRVLDAYLSINDVFGPCKSDFFRYLVLYKEGGVYLDNKSIIIKNLDKFLKDSSGKLLITSHNFSLLNKINIFSIIHIIILIKNIMLNTVSLFSGLLLLILEINC
jgi:mannosyltransferase OCH1-like enzyme